MVNGRSISKAENDSVVVVDLPKTGKDNKIIGFLTKEARSGNKPFSRGFSMQYTEVLTDKDFDKCYPYVRVRKTAAFDE